jgi:hypothetical protein
MKQRYLLPMLVLGAASIVTFAGYRMTDNSGHSQGDDKQASANNENPNYDNIEAELRRDLPVGSSYESIDAYLTHKRLTHSYFPKSNMFQASTPEAPVLPIKGLPITRNSWIRIQLDENKLLRSITVETIYTGP